MNRRELIAGARRRRVVADRGARAAAGEAADDRLPGCEHACRLEPMGPGF